MVGFKYLVSHFPIHVFKSDVKLNSFSSNFITEFILLKEEQKSQRQLALSCFSFLRQFGLELCNYREGWDPLIFDKALCISTYLVEFVDIQNLTSHIQNQIYLTLMQSQITEDSCYQSYKDIFLESYIKIDKMIIYLS